MRIVWGLVAALVVMVMGFWPSFFSNPAQNDLLHTVHGALASGWMLILIVQAWLMAKGYLRAHHMIGRLSIAWVIALLVSATMIVVYGLGATGDRALPMPWRPVLAMIDIPSLLIFAGLYITAIWCAFRRKIDVHYRAMLSTVIIIFTPALGRFLPLYIPGIKGLMEGLNPTFWICEGVCVALLAYDAIKYRKTWPPYWVALGGLVAIQLAMFHAAEIPPFVALIRWMGYPA
jgi:hypothetical protein